MVVASTLLVESEAVGTAALPQILRRKTRTVSAGGAGGTTMGPITCHDDLQTAIEPTPGGDEVPVDAFRDDIQRKIKLKKVMGPPDPEDKKFKLKQKSKEAQGDDVLDDVDSTGMGDDDTDVDQPEPGEQYMKEEVNYRYSGDKNEACINCVHFVHPGACEIVAGLIRAVDVCDEFEDKHADETPLSYDQQPDESEDVHHNEIKPGQTKLSSGGVVQSHLIITSEVAPPGWSGTAKAMKGKKGIDNPFALAWYMKNKGDTPHYKPESEDEDGDRGNVVHGRDQSGQQQITFGRRVSDEEEALQRLAMKLAGEGDADPDSPFVTGGPGSGRTRSKFAPKEKSSDEDRQVSAFTRREKPAERAERVASKKVDPETASAVKRAFTRATLVAEHSPAYGTYVIPPIEPSQRHASEIMEYSPDQPREHGRFAKGGGSKGASAGKSGKGSSPRGWAYAPAYSGKGATVPKAPVNKPAQRAQHVAQVRKDVHGARVDQATNQKVIDNLRKMGFFSTEKEVVVESVAVV